MKCAWTQLLSVLPFHYREQIENLSGFVLQEVRLRIDRQPEIVCSHKTIWLKENVRREDLDFCINIASRYSPWAVSSVTQGYITAPGGHRIGLCGEIVVNGQGTIIIKNPTSLCIRVANQIADLACNLQHIKGSTLIIGKPGSGKTTFLRDYINLRSDRNGEHIVAVDERAELFPAVDHTFLFPPGKKVDVMLGCTKTWGIDRAIKVMGPDAVALDEITSEADCNAVAAAARCGVDVIATAHGSSLDDLKNRRIYQPLYALHLFDHLICMHADKTWTEEEIVYDN